jgi:hypothetical protein
MMPDSTNFWAIGFDDLGGADRFQNAITGLATLH